MTTLIKQIVIGTPVRRVYPVTDNINDLEGVDTSTKVNGSVLVYNASSDTWEATLDLQAQNINGGSY